MAKKSIWQIICAVFLAVLSVLSVAPLEHVGANDSSRWMQRLEDDRLIAELSIPGSHDSGATHSIADVAGKCQSLSLAAQLHAGVRFLDIRLQNKQDSLVLVHSFVDQRLSFANALDGMATFIRENPTEFLLMSIKEDADEVDATVSFSDAVKAALSAHSDVVCLDTSLPQTVGQARGKIYIISRYWDQTVGVPAYSGWRDSTSFEIGDFYVQDHYSLESVEEKKADIAACFEKSASKQYTLVLNFASCYLTNAFPPLYAGTPAREINPWLIQTVSQVQGGLGVVIVDFVTTELARAIYGRNFV